MLAGTGLPFVLARMGVDPANAGTSIQARAHPLGFLRPYGAYNMTWEGHMYIWAVPYTYHIYGAARSKEQMLAVGVFGNWLGILSRHKHMRKASRQTCACWHHNE